MKMKTVAELTKAETAEFVAWKATIEACIAKPFEMGKALRTIRDKELYLVSHGTLADYAVRRFTTS